MTYRPAVRQPVIDPTTGSVRTVGAGQSTYVPGRIGSIGYTISGPGGAPVSSPSTSAPRPSRAPSGLPNINGPAYATAPANRSPDVGYEGPPDQYTPGNPGPGRFERDANGNFLAGDPGAYAGWYAGAYPNGPVGNYQDALAIAAKNAAQNNYGANSANLDLQENSLLNAFNELSGNLDKSKGRSLGSLADSMADRGLSQSGIFLGSTNDVQQTYADQLAQAARQKDEQRGGIQRERVNLSNLLAQAIADAEQASFNRAIEAWQERQRQALERANATLATYQGG